MGCYNTTEAKWKVVFGLGLLAGVLALVVGVATPIVLTFPYQEIFRKQVEDWIVIDSKRSDRYEDWVSYYSYSNPYYLTVYFWNLTNPQDVLNRTLGVKPTYKSVGPYVYRRYRLKQNVAFLADDHSVQYEDQEWYEWCPGMSVGNESDLLVNINPAYLHLMHLTDGEYRLQLAISGTELNGIMNFMNTTFVADYVANAYGEVLNVAVPALLVQLNESLGGWNSAVTFFYSYWANGTAPPPIFADWAGMLLWPGNPSANPDVWHLGLAYPSLIPMQTARRLFDPAQPFSLLNATSAPLGGPWSVARNSSAMREVLMKEFNLTATQLNTILFWLANSFREFKVMPYLLSKYALENITDLAYLQWGSALPLEGRSVQDMYPTRFERGAPELVFQPNVPKEVKGNIPYRVARQFLSGPYGVTQPNNILLFVDEFAQPKPDFSLWGFPPDHRSEPDAALSYIVNFVTVNYTLPDLAQSLESGGSIITTRTVNQILWNCSDPTMELVYPGFNCALLQNNTFSLPNIIDCGCSNISMIEQYRVWHNVTQITDVWQATTPVVGSSKSAQFPPFLEKNTKLQYWEGALLRPISLQKVGETKNQYDISVWKYQITDQVWQNTSLYTEEVPGFANMTKYHPLGLYYSNWDMLGVPPANSTDLIDGLNPTTPTNDSTCIEIEPITGIAMGWKQRLQMNVWVPPGVSKSWLYIYNPTFADGIFYPIIKYIENAQINSNQAQEFKDKVERLLWFQTFFFWLSLALGIVLFVASVVSVAVGGGCLWKIRKEKAGYDQFFSSGIERGEIVNSSFSATISPRFSPRGRSPVFHTQGTIHLPPQHRYQPQQNYTQHKQHRQHVAQQQHGRRVGGGYDSSFTASERTISSGDLYLSN